MVDGNYISPVIQIRRADNMNVLVSFQKQDLDKWVLYSKNSSSSSSANLVDFLGVKYFNQKEIHHDDEIRLMKIMHRNLSNFFQFF